MTTTQRRTVPGAGDTTIDDVTAWWSTDISDISPGIIRYHGYPIEELIPTTSYAAMVLCSAPWYWNTRRMSLVRPISSR